MTTLSPGEPSAATTAGDTASAPVADESHNKSGNPSEKDVRGPASLDASLSRAVRLVGAVVAPTTLVTALLFYFGWARTNAQSQTMGLPQSLLGYSTQDYLLRSVRPMFLPIVVGLSLVAVGLVTHSRLLRSMARLRRDDAHRARRRLRIAFWAGMIAGFGVIAGGLRLVLAQGSSGNLVGPLLLTVGMTLVSYFAYVLSHPLVGRDGGTPPARRMAPVQGTIVVMLLALGLFWTVSEYAGSVGRRLGDGILEGRIRLPQVVVYSPRRLYIDFDGVSEQHLDDKAGAYQFRYEGLEFIESTGGKYFLRPAKPPEAQPAPETIVVIPAEDAPQLQFRFVR